jgi:UDP-2,3-diacylglucosamine hydrolase
MAVLEQGGKPSDQGSGPLAIICGGGSLPLAVADAVAGRGRRVVLFPVRGWADPAAVAHYPHHWIGLAQIVRLQRLARREGCRELVFIGAVLRPSPRQLRPDLGTLRLLPRIVRLFLGGDDHLLTGLGRLFEEAGFRLLGAHEVAPEIVVPAGALGRRGPSPRDLADIARGLSLISAMGSFDIGQAVVIADNRVLAVEATEGTDHMLARVAELRREGRIGLPKKVGVLVKAPKPGQDRRFDLPSIGVRTVAGVAAAGLAGIAVEAEGAIAADLQDTIRAADAAGLFVFGRSARRRPDARATPVKRQIDPVRGRWRPRDDGRRPDEPLPDRRYGVYGHHRGPAASSNHLASHPCDCGCGERGTAGCSCYHRQSRFHPSGRAAGAGRTAGDPDRGLRLAVGLGLAAGAS